MNETPMDATESEATNEEPANSGPPGSDSDELSSRVSLLRPQVLLLEVPPELPPGAAGQLLKIVEHRSAEISGNFDLIIDTRQSPVPRSADRQEIVAQLNEMPNLRRVFVVADRRMMRTFVRIVSASVRSIRLVTVQSIDEAVQRTSDSSFAGNQPNAAPFPVRTVVAGLVGVVLVLTFGMIVRNTARDIQADVYQEVESITEGIGLIRHYDEVLTMSARMTAETGDSAWADRYFAAREDLDQAMAETAAALADRPLAASALAETAQANQRLYVLEDRALELTTQGRLERAQGLFDNRAYQNEKADYAAGLEATINNTAIDSQALQQASDTWETIVVWSSILAIVIVIGVGVLIVRAVHRWATTNLELTNEFAAELHEMATHDELTGLHNRRAFFDRLDDALSRQERSGKGIGVLMIDVNRFKEINDHFGHTAGDTALFELGKRLKSATRSADTVARMGGDEFCVLAENIDSHDELALAEGRLRKSANGPLVTDHGRVDIAVSIGAKLIQRHDRPIHIEGVMRDIDQRMYRDKSDQRSTDGI